MNEKLRQDVELLRSKRIIKRDRDIIEQTGVNKSALSNYLSGKIPASKNFIDNFYNVFGKYLDVNKVAEAEPIYQRKGNITYVPISAQGGFLTGYANEIYLDSLQHFSLPGIAGQHYAFEVDGMSMYDFAAPGDWAIASSVEKFDYMLKGKPYVLQTTDGLIIKYFAGLNLRDEKALFTSHNKDYPAFSLPLKSIKKIYFVSRIVKKV